MLRKALLAAIAVTFVSAGTAMAADSPVVNTTYQGVYGSDSTNRNTTTACGNDGYQDKAHTGSIAYGILGLDYAKYTVNNNLAVDELTTSRGSVLIVGGNLTSSTDITLNGDGAGYYYHAATQTETSGHAWQYYHNAYTQVAGSMTATNGIKINGSEIVVGGTWKADSIKAAADVTFDDNLSYHTLYAPTESTQSGKGGDMVAETGDINITSPKVDVYGDMDAQKGSITLNGGKVTVTGVVKADDYLDINNVTTGSSVGGLSAGKTDDKGNKIHITNSTLTVTGSVNAWNDQKESNVTANKIVVDGSSNVTVDGSIFASNGTLVVGAVAKDGTSADTATLTLSGTLKYAQEDDKPGSLIDETISAITVNQGDKIAALGKVSTVGTTETIYGTVTGTEWANDGVTTVDGTDTNEGVLSVTNSATLGGETTVTGGGSIVGTNVGAALIFTGATIVTSVDNAATDAVSSIKTMEDSSAISLTGDNDIVNGDVIAEGKDSTIHLKTDNSITLGSLVQTKGSGGTVIVEGENNITSSEVSAIGANSTVTVTGTSTISGATITAGDVANLTTNEDGSTVTIEETTADGETKITDTDITSAGNIIISSVNSNPVVISNEDATQTTTIVAYNDKPEADGNAIHFNNVVLNNINTKADEKEVYAHSGSILFSGSMNEMTKTELSTGSGSALYDGDDKNDDAAAAVRLASNAVLKMHEQTHFDSKLESKDMSATIIKDGKDTLTLDYSARGYNGAINVLADDGSDMVINCDGVGMDARINLKDTNLDVTAKAFAAAQDGKVQIGSVDTTADDGSREVGEGTVANSHLVQMADGSYSYTNDGNSRDTFKNIGSVISFNDGKFGDTVVGKDMTLDAPTLLRLDVGLDTTIGSATEGKPVSDVIELSGAFTGNNARVFQNVAKDDALNSTVLDDQTTRTFIEGTTAGQSINEDVLYAVSKDATDPNATYQREMQLMNVWARTNDDGVELVYSHNFRTAEGKDYNQTQLAGVLNELSKRHNQAEGNRQMSDNRFENLLDAFDYTRTEGDALDGLTSVCGAANTVAQHSVMESSRHHLDTLRQWIALPTCPEQAQVNPADAKGAPVTMTQPVDAKSNVWATYTGGFDMIDESSANMGGYTRSYQGGMLGYSREVNCKLLLGVDVAFENSVSRTDLTHFHADSYLFDLYGSARTGRFNHRFSVGMGIHDFSSDRTVLVNAAAHTFNDKAYGNFMARSINVGYELSTDFEVTERATVSPYLAVNYAYHSFSTLREGGLDTAGLVTELEDMNQLEVAAGARYAYSFGLVKDQAPATCFASA